MSKPLTQEEVDALPDGTPIVVTWSGGNGPHEYIVRRNQSGVTTAHYLHPVGQEFFVGILSMCGPHPLTQVRLAARTPDAGRGSK